MQSGRIDNGFCGRQIAVMFGDSGDDSAIDDQMAATAPAGRDDGTILDNSLNAHRIHLNVLCCRYRKNQKHNPLTDRAIGPHPGYLPQCNPVTMQMSPGNISAVQIFLMAEHAAQHFTPFGSAGKTACLFVVGWLVPHCACERGLLAFASLMHAAIADASSQPGQFAQAGPQTASSPRVKRYRTLLRSVPITA